MTIHCQAFFSVEKVHLRHLSHLVEWFTFISNSGLPYEAIKYDAKGAVAWWIVAYIALIPLKRSVSFDIFFFSGKFL